MLINIMTGLTRNTTARADTLWRLTIIRAPPPAPHGSPPGGVLTWCSLPEGLHALLSHDLPGGVKHARVGGLAGPGRHLRVTGAQSVSGAPAGCGGDGTGGRTDRAVEG